jgi:hypothetical protein
LSFIGLRAQRQHDILSVRPLPEVTVADYEDSLRIKIRNNGVAPLLVARIGVKRNDGEKESIIAWMPPLPDGRPWTHFSTDLADRSLPPNGALPLLELTQFEGERNFADCRDLVRQTLRDLTVEVRYSDIYGTVFPPYSKSLKWFARNL